MGATVTPVGGHSTGIIAASDRAGTFIFEDLKASTEYALVVAAPGYQVAAVLDVPVVAKKRLNIIITLKEESREQELLR